VVPPSAAAGGALGGARCRRPRARRRAAAAALPREVPTRAAECRRRAGARSADFGSPAFACSSPAPPPPPGLVRPSTPTRRRRQPRAFFSSRRTLRPTRPQSPPPPPLGVCGCPHGRPVPPTPRAGVLSALRRRGGAICVPLVRGWAREATPRTAAPMSRQVVVAATQFACGPSAEANVRRAERLVRTF